MINYLVFMFRTHWIWWKYKIKFKYLLTWSKWNSVDMWAFLNISRFGWMAPDGVNTTTPLNELEYSSNAVFKPIKLYINWIWYDILCWK